MPRHCLHYSFCRGGRQPRPPERVNPGHSPSPMTSTGALAALPPQAPCPPSEQWGAELETPRTPSHSPPRFSVNERGISKVRVEQTGDLAGRVKVCHLSRLTVTFSSSNLLNSVAVLFSLWRGFQTTPLYFHSFNSGFWAIRGSCFVLTGARRGRR